MAPTRPPARRSLLDLRPSYFAVVAAVSLFPIGRMLHLVRSGTHLQYNDYWYAFDRSVSDTGWLRLDNILEFDFAHLLAIPNAIYWLNARLLSGSNVTLGYFVILVVIAQVVLLWKLLPARTSLPEPLIATLAIAVPVLLFAVNGAWNFLVAMSGTAWLTANLLVIAAIVAAQRDNPWAAGALALLASVTYGTGLTAWPAVLVVLLLGGRSFKRTLPLAMVAAVVGGAYAWFYSPPEALKATRPTWSEPLDVLGNGAALVGSVLVSDRALALWIGAAALLFLTAAATFCVIRRVPGSAPWVGLALSATLSTLMIGFERNVEVDVPSRYGSVASLVWICLLVLLSLTRLPRPATVLVAATVPLLVLFARTDRIDSITMSYDEQDELADALRLDVAGGVPQLLVGRFPELSDRLRLMDHYPFSDDYRADCGLLGTKLDHDASRSSDRAVAGEISGTGPHPTYTRALRLQGHLNRPSSQVACIIVTDESGSVVGVGRPTSTDETDPGSADPDTTAFEALAPMTADEVEIWVRYRGADDLHLIGSAQP
ncbi:MAG: hypothetical protein GX643_02170 [Acidimicrobiales bacterium]|nr:hypothetical protein [Acidimicrobiales bacterium]